MVNNSSLNPVIFLYPSLRRYIFSQRKLVYSQKNTVYAHHSSYCEGVSKNKISGFRQLYNGIKRLQFLEFYLTRPDKLTRDTLLFIGIFYLLSPSNYFPPYCYLRLQSHHGNDLNIHLIPRFLASTGDLRSFPFFSLRRDLGGLP